MRAVDYIAQKLVESGISDVFSVTGGGSMYLNDAFGHKEGLHCTYNHHEQASAMAAEAYARVNNIPSAVCVTTGPGAVNALTGVLCAWMESIPMIVFSGQARYETTVRGMGLKLRSAGVQEYDVTKSAGPMTKYAVMVTKAADIRYCLEKALYLMMSRRRGPVWLDIPLDVQRADIVPEKLRAYDPKEDPEEEVPHISDEAISETVRHLLAAARPVLFGGFGVRASGAADKFRKLADIIGCPVLTGASSVDLIEEDYPGFVGRTGMSGSRAGNLAMAGSDFFLSIGSRQSFLQTGYDYKDWAREAYTVINDLDPEELKKPNVHVDLPVIGDAGEFMDKLIAALGREGYSEGHPVMSGSGWTERSVERKKIFPVVTRKEKGPQPDGLANIYNFYDKLSIYMKEDDVLLVSVGTSRVAGTQAFRVKKGQRFYTNSATASMGYGLPAAIGLSRAYGGRAVNLVTGDGSLMMNLQELQTIKTCRIPVRIFVICNGGYHSIRQTQHAYFNDGLVGVGPESRDLDFPDLDKLADLFGFEYIECSNNENVGETVRDALNCSCAVICRVAVSTLQATEPKSGSYRRSDGTSVTLPLEDMTPFLEKDVLAENLEIALTDDEVRR